MRHAAMVGISRAVCETEAFAMILAAMIHGMILMRAVVTAASRSMMAVVHGMVLPAVVHAVAAVILFVVFMAVTAASRSMMAVVHGMVLPAVVHAVAAVILSVVFMAVAAASGSMPAMIHGMILVAVVRAMILAARSVSAAVGMTAMVGSMTTGTMSASGSGSTATSTRTSRSAARSCASLVERQQSWCGVGCRRGQAKNSEHATAVDVFCSYRVERISDPFRVLFLSRHDFLLGISHEPMHDM
jgi:hypothetical protein